MQETPVAPPPHLSSSPTSDDAGLLPNPERHLEALSKKRSGGFVRLFQTTSRTSTSSRTPQPRVSTSQPPRASADTTPALDPDATIDLGQSPADDEEDAEATAGIPVINVTEPQPPSSPKRDRYEWAVLYENQRGVTIFKVPHYSRASLLPNDPPPFTVPTKDSSDSCHDKVRMSASLRDYQLPDARWKWVSRQWMVDMRGDGEVQEDGFEYNWFFRKRGWKPVIGVMSAGAWVRRRRWIRLMMRPASPTEPNFPDSSASSSFTGSSPDSTSTSFVDTRDVWMGDAEGDWARCKVVLRMLGRDGKRIECWRTWLGLEKVRRPSDMIGFGLELAEDGEADADAAATWSPTRLYDDADRTMNGSSKALDDGESQWLERDFTRTPYRDGSRTPDPQSQVQFQSQQLPNREWIEAVISKHAHEIMSSFIYPHARARFLEMLSDAGINNPSVLATLGKDVDFWSAKPTTATLQQS